MQGTIQLIKLAIGMRPGQTAIADHLTNNDPIFLFDKALVPLLIKKGNRNRKEDDFCEAMQFPNRDHRPLSLIWNGYPTAKMIVAPYRVLLRSMTHALGTFGSVAGVPDLLKGTGHPDRSTRTRKKNVTASITMAATPRKGRSGLKNVIVPPTPRRKTTT